MAALQNALSIKRNSMSIEKLQESTVVEYIWLGGSGMDLRGKSKVIPGVVTSIEQCPVWNYDGSSTGQGKTAESEIVLKPAKICKDPFREGNHLLCLCETFMPNGEPTVSNFRHLAKKVFDETSGEQPWFGIEQEYILFKVESVHCSYPIGWGKDGYNAPQGMYYCGIGSGYVYGRQVAEDHLRACLLAGLDIAGINAEVFPGQWEFQNGICYGIDMADQLWLTRYILQRVCETYGMLADFKPKPLKGDWNGSGCHTNFSTNSTRDKTKGWETFMSYLDSLKSTHLKCMSLYGSGNEKRMSGLHETARYDEFTYGIGARGCSVRIGNEAKADGCGYFEDRRPSSNIDPYLSCSALVDVCCNNAKNLDALVDANAKMREGMEFTYME